MELNGDLFMGRQLTVQPKRKNIPGRGRARATNPIMTMMSLMMNSYRGGRGGRGRGMMDPFMRGRGGRGMSRGVPRGGAPP